tara:strand:- start:85 stop:1425 length:1341 start_codon:yes stop_codon:yes gene_type:complete
MSIVIEMPKLSDTMSVGTVVKWHKSVGDQVANGDTLAEIETDKATMELENFDDGILLKILVSEGEEAPIGSPLAVVGEEGESVEVEEIDTAKPESDSDKESTQSLDSTADDSNESEEKDEKVFQKENQIAPSTTEESRIIISPLAKKLAKENNLDISKIQGSGPSGRIVKIDILEITGSLDSGNDTPDAIETKAVENHSSKIVSSSGLLSSKSIKVSSMRSTIARRLTESKQNIPHFYLQKEIDAIPLKNSREAINKSIAEKTSLLTQGSNKGFSINDFILKACAETIKWHPEINSSWNETEIIYHPEVNLSFGVAIEGGLLTPVINGACKMSLSEISVRAKQLITKAREKKLQPNEMAGSTFTVTNLGMFGIDSFSGIINPPNAAILSVGSSKVKAVVDKNGQITTGETITLGLSCDHRLVDGAVAAKFFQTLANHLENPSTFLI